MYAVVANARIEPGRAEDATAHLQSTVVPRVKEVPGVVSGYWTRSSDGEHGTAMVVFESEDAARAAAEQVPNMAPEYVHFDSIEVREVVAQL
jgi:heme-degrading monooxygenase HmoA